MLGIAATRASTVKLDKMKLEKSSKKQRVKMGVIKTKGKMLVQEQMVMKWLWIKLTSKFELLIAEFVRQKMAYFKNTCFSAKRWDAVSWTAYLLCRNRVWGGKRFLPVLHASCATALFLLGHELFWYHSLLIGYLFFNYLWTVSFSFMGKHCVEVQACTWRLRANSHC